MDFWDPDFWAEGFWAAAFWAVSDDPATIDRFLNGTVRRPATLTATVERNDVIL